MITDFHLYSHRNRWGRGVGKTVRAVGNARETRRAPGGQGRGQRPRGSIKKLDRRDSSI